MHSGSKASLEFYNEGFVVDFDLENCVSKFYSDNKLCKSISFGSSPEWLEKRLKFTLSFLELAQSKKPSFAIKVNGGKAVFMSNGLGSDCKLTQIDEQIQLNFIKCKNTLVYRNRASISYIDDPFSCIYSGKDASVLLKFIHAYKSCLKYRLNSLTKNHSTDCSFEEVTYEFSRNLQTNNSLYNFKNDRASDITRFVNYKMAHIPGVGWCIFYSAKHISLLFNDGLALGLNFELNNVAVSKGDTEHGWFNLDDSIPQYIKTKLSHLLNFLKLINER